MATLLALLVTVHSTLSLSPVEGRSDTESSTEDSASESEKGVNKVKSLMSVSSLATDILNLEEQKAMN